MSSTDVCPRILVIASGNAGKVREFRNLLAHLPLQLQSQPEGLQVDETGTTFAANARLKALAVARCSGRPRVRSVRHQRPARGSRRRLRS